MTGMLSQFATETTWFTGPALALTAAAVLSGWWIVVVLQTVRDRDEVSPPEDLIEPRFR